ncbi:MAG: hypothetical protein ACK4UN_19965, partial [Limisphaerales bacterium]
GLPQQAKSMEWPPAKLKWTRTAEAEFVVYEHDINPVQLTTDASLDPMRTGSISVEKIVVRRVQDKTNAFLEVKASRPLNVPVAFDVSIRINDEVFHAGNVWYVLEEGSSMSGGTQLKAEVPFLSPAVQSAEVILKPNPSLLYGQQGVDRVWGKEIVIPRVPLARHDQLAGD